MAAPVVLFTTAMVPLPVNGVMNIGSPGAMSLSIAPGTVLTDARRVSASISYYAG
jgi:hypothetical protein